MIRLFVGLAIPEPIAQSLLMLQGGVVGARWQEREQLHLTLRFIGDVDRRQLRDVEEALERIQAPVFELELGGVGVFTQKDPKRLWVGARGGEALRHLQRKIDTAITRIGLLPDGKKFSPHVTLARLKAPRHDTLLTFLQGHALYGCPPFAVDRFTLFRSTLSTNGSVYTVEREFALKDSPTRTE